MRRFIGKTVILTEINSPILENASKELAREGANLAIHSSDYDDLREHFGLLLNQGVSKDQISLIHTKIDTEEGRKVLIRDALKKFHKIDVVILANNDKELLNVFLSLSIPHLTLTNGKFILVGDKYSSEVDPELLEQCNQQGIRFDYVKTSTIRPQTHFHEAANLILFLASDDPEKYKIAAATILNVMFMAIFVATMFLSAIPQPQDYHDYADKRVWMGVPYASYVLSNIGFLITGGYGAMRLMTSGTLFRTRFIDPWEFKMYLHFFLTIFATGFGSAYYHWTPNNETLFWDRVPMSMAFMSLFSAVLTERVSKRLGIISFPLLQVYGVLATCHWIFSERAGHGDVRLYGLVQVIPTLAFPVILLTFPSRYTGTRFLVYALGCFLLARVFELTDKVIFKLTFNTIGGHVLKHVFASFTVWFVYYYVNERIPIERAVYYLYEIRVIRKVIDFGRKIFNFWKKHEQ